MADPKRRSSQAKRLEEALERELGRAMQSGASPRRASTRATSGVERRVRDVLTPVEPSQQFIRELGHGLSLTAERSRRSLVRRYRMAIIIGAAIFGSLASVVGVVALILRQRSRVRVEFTN